MIRWPPLRHNVLKQISAKLNTRQTRMKCKKSEIWETHDHRYVLPDQARLTVAPLHRSHRHCHSCACCSPYKTATHPKRPHIGSIQNRGGPISIPRTKAPELKCSTHAIQATIITTSSLLNKLKFSHHSWELRARTFEFRVGGFPLQFEIAECADEIVGNLQFWIARSVAFGVRKSVLHLLHTLVMDGEGGRRGVTGGWNWDDGWMFWMKHASAKGNQI